MTPAEIHAEICALAAEAGSRATVNVTIGGGGAAVGPYIFGFLYPDGITGATAPIRMSGNDFTTVLAGLRAKWDERAETHRRETIRKLALAIIRITADRGECTDRDLRVEFDAEEVARYSADAVADANAIAANGPFAVVATDGGNARAAA